MTARQAVRNVSWDVWWGFRHPGARLRGVVPVRPARPRHRRTGRPEPVLPQLAGVAAALAVAAAGAAAYVWLLLAG